MNVPSKFELRQEIARKDDLIAKLTGERDAAVDRELAAVREKLRKHHDLYRYASRPPELCPECHGLLSMP